MSIIAGDPLLQVSFSIYENKGVFALLLGSGLSRAAGIPTGWEITVDLIRRVGEAQGAGPQADWAQWYQSKTGLEPKYSALLEDLASSPAERRSILHPYIVPTDDDQKNGRKLPTKAHRAIANLVRDKFIRVIITTNFDRLMENALREVGVEPTIITSVDALKGAEPITHSDCYILKLHGDYKDARILNTDDELSTYPTEYNELLDRIFDEYGLIVCGWSGEWDHALRAALLRAPNRRYPIFWAARGDVGSGAQAIISHRSAKMITIDGADTLFSSLERHIKTLERTHQKNPSNITHLIGLTKRFIEKPEHRIQLDDFLTQECEKLTELLKHEEDILYGPKGTADFTTHVQRREAATEALAKIAGTLGRWGDGSELRHILDIIENVRSYVVKNKLNSACWLYLRTYPAVLILTAYGLGLTRAERWTTLRDLLTAPISHHRQKPVLVVQELFLTEWAGGNNDYWHNNCSREDNHAPLSGHLFSIFQSWSKSFLGIINNFEILFHQFELLASISYLDGKEIKKSESSIRANPFDDTPRMPMGRAAGIEEKCENLVKMFKAEKFSAAILAANFAGGSADRLNKTLAIFETKAMWMRMKK